MFDYELAANPFFQGIAPDQLERVATLLSPAHFRAGDRVFDQGETATLVYLLEAGEIALRLYPEDGGCLTIAVIYPQGICGWSAVLGRARYTSSAICAVDARALLVKGSELRAFVHREPGLGRLLLGRMALAVAGRADGTHLQLARLIQEEMAHAAT